MRISLRAAALAAAAFALPAAGQIFPGTESRASLGVINFTVGGSRAE
jgi:hypothetical protein